MKYNAYRLKKLASVVNISASYGTQVIRVLSYNGSIVLDQASFVSNMSFALELT